MGKCTTFPPGYMHLPSAIWNIGPKPDETRGPEPDPRVSAPTCRSSSTAVP